VSSIRKEKALVFAQQTTFVPPVDYVLFELEPGLTTQIFTTQTGIAILLLDDVSPK